MVVLMILNNFGRKIIAHLLKKNIGRLLSMSLVVGIANHINFENSTGIR